MPAEAKRWMDRAAEIDSQHPMSRAAPLFLNYHSQRNEGDNVRLARALLEDKIQARNGSRYMALEVLLDYASETGDFDIILEELDKLYPHLFDEPPHDLDKSYTGTYYAGVALMRSGEIDRGTAFLRWWKDERDLIDDTYITSRWSVAASLMLGDREEALQKLDSFAETKYITEFNRTMLEYDATFDPIRAEPAFIAILDEYRENAEKQRQLLQAMNED
jgi:hypothetical protein